MCYIYWIYKKRIFSVTYSLWYIVKYSTRFEWETMNVEFILFIPILKHSFTLTHTHTSLLSVRHEMENVGISRRKIWIHIVVECRIRKRSEQYTERCECLFLHHCSLQQQQSCINTPPSKYFTMPIVFRIARKRHTHTHKRNVRLFIRLLTHTRGCVRSIEIAALNRSHTTVSRDRQ